MYIVDMHCDSLIKVGGDKGIVNAYNFSAKYPHLQFAAAFVPNSGRTARERRLEVMQHFNVYLSEKERLGMIGVASAEDVYRFEDEEARSCLFSIEGGAGLFADSAELEALATGGLRVMSIAWDKNELASTAWDECDEGLTELGRQMVKKCDSLGIIGDVSHLSDKSFFELMEISHYPVLATHSNFRELCNSKRNLTREMAEMIVERGGVIGLNLYPAFLRDGGGADLNDILRHVDYALEHFGDASLGFGFDIDGVDSYPVGISEHSSIHDQVIDLLLKHYSLDVVEKIAGKNVMNFLKNNLA